MRNLFVLGLVTFFVLFLGGCSSSGITTEAYAELESKLETANASYATLTNDYDTLSKEHKAALEKIEEYKKIIQPYIDLSQAELEAEKAAANTKRLEEEAKEKELEKEKKAKEAKEKGEREAREALEKAEKEKKEKQGYETGVTYSQLARNPDDYLLNKIKFKGKVIQVLEGDKANTLRFAVDSDYDKIMIVEYDKSIVSSRILEDDIITIYGVSYGLYTYESTMGAPITIPSAVLDKIDQ